MRITGGCGAALLAGAAMLGGCVGNEDIEDHGALADSESAIKTSAEGDFWMAPFISVLTPPNVTGKKVLDIRDASQANGARAQLWDRTGGDNQVWFVTDVGSLSGHRVYRLSVGHSGKCLDMAIDGLDGPLGNGTRVQQWDCSSDGLAQNQQWVAVPVTTDGSNWISLQSRLRPSLCLDVSKANFANGALLQVWQCTGNTWNQRWNIFP